MSAASVLYTVAPKYTGVKASKQKALIDALDPFFYKVLKDWGIDTKQRIACFIGQTMVECDYYTTTVEYGPARPNYEGGYKGRGLIQLTHLSNYRAAGKDLGLDLVNHPEIAERPYEALLVSCWFWKKNNLNRWADANDLKALGNAINRGNPNYSGYSLGHSARVQYTEKAKQALINEDISVKTPMTEQTAVATGTIGLLSVGLFFQEYWIPLTLSAGYRGWEDRTLRPDDFAGIWGAKVVYATCG